MQKTLAIAFLGLGEHAIRAHLKHLRTLQERGEEIDLWGAFDPRDEAFEEVQRELGIRLHRYESEEALVNDPDVDIVFICSHDKHHGRQLQLASQAGKHIFCEKPIMVHPEDAKILNEALNKAFSDKLVLSTCHPRRYDPPFMWLKDNLPRLVAELGEVMHFDFSFFYHEVTDEWKKDRSLLSDHFGHEIDIYRFLFGNTNVHAKRLRDSYDVYEVLGRTWTYGEEGRRRKAGPTFRFYGSRALVESVYNETIRIDFRKGALYINLNSGEAIHLPSGHRTTVPKMDYDARFLAVNQNFLAAIRGQAASYLTDDDLLCNNGMSLGLTKYGEADWRA